MGPAPLSFDAALRERVRSNLAAFDRRGYPGSDLRAAAVALALLADERGEPCFVLTRRADSLRAHGGQWALPGGRLDSGESATEAALRELEEEVGLSLPPGPIRVAQSKYLDKALASLAKPIVPIAAGATVAHLSFYLAQHLGCDPIILIGQDLAFSDGLYYCPGTAIHDVWATELGQFNTLEMMEWQRIVRHRGALERIE